MQEGKPEDPEKPAEASMDWKPNANTNANNRDEDAIKNIKREAVVLNYNNRSISQSVNKSID